MSSSLDKQLNKRNTGDTGGPHEAESVLVSSDNVNFSSALTINFTTGGGGNWTDAQTIYVKAAHDDALEGDRNVMISHSIHVESSDPANEAVQELESFAIPNVDVNVIDD